MESARSFDGLPVVEPDSVEQWRDWLARHGETSGPVWVVTRPNGPGVRFRQAIEHALCYGWVDSLAKKPDPDSCLLRFAARRPTSSWGPGNRARAARLIAAGLMAPAGLGAIKTAKANGRWGSEPS